MRRVVLPTPPTQRRGGSRPRCGPRGATYLSLRHSSGRRVRVLCEEGESERRGRAGAGSRARSVAARSGGGPRGRAGRRGGAGGRLAALAADPTNLNRVFIKFYIEPDAAQPVPAGSPPPRQPIGPRGSRGVGPGGEGTGGALRRWRARN